MKTPREDALELLKMLTQEVQKEEMDVAELLNLSGRFLGVFSYGAGYDDAQVRDAARIIEHGGRTERIRERIRYLAHELKYAVNLELLGSCDDVRIAAEELLSGLADEIRKWRADAPDPGEIVERAGQVVGRWEGDPL